MQRPLGGVRAAAQAQGAALCGDPRDASSSLCCGSYSGLPPVKPQEGAAGINTSVPDGKAQATVGDKRKAAEQLRSEEQQQRRMMTLGDNSFSLLDDGLKPAEEPAPADNPALRASEANRAMQRQVQGFYAAPQRNAEVEALKEQVAALRIPARRRAAAARSAGTGRGAVQARPEVSRRRSGRR